MKHRLLSLALALCMVMALLPGQATALAASVPVEYDTTYNVPGGKLYLADYSNGDEWGYEIVNADATVTQAVIPDTINGKHVLSIGKSAFFNTDSRLTKVVVPGTVEYIKHGAFDGCSSLTDVTLNEGLVHLERYAFDDCRMESIYLPSTLASIEDNSALNPSVLKTIRYGGTAEQWRKLDFFISSGWGWDGLITCADGKRLMSMSFNLWGGTITSPGGSFFEDASSYAETVGMYAVVGQPLGQLPTVDRNGYCFDGWYQYNSQGYLGEEITSETIASPNLLRRINAKYSPAPDGEQHTITFDPDGGTVDVTSKTVVNGQPYGEMPVPTRQGFTFYGWYERGKVAGYGAGYTAAKTVRLTKDITLVAVWKGNAVCHVTFDPNGGDPLNVSPNLPVYPGGGVYDFSDFGYTDLPRPTRDGYYFVGWFTSPTGGEQVKWKDPVLLDYDHTLYAHWIPVSGLSLGQLTYSFSNSWDDFGYSSSYRIPYDRYKLIYGDTAFAQRYYESAGAWGGNCFGMSATSLMVTQVGNGITAGGFRGGASLPSQLSPSDRDSSLGLTLREFIEAMQISQRAPAIQEEEWENEDDLAGLRQAILDSKKNNTLPPIVCIYGLTNKGQLSGHAMVAYDLVNSYEIKLYDCNFPGQDRTMRGTIYNLNDVWEWGGSHGGASLTWVTYDTLQKVWDNRGAGNTWEGYLLVQLNSTQATIRDEKGQVAAAITDGIVSPGSKKAKQYVEVGVMPDGSTAATGTALWLPVGSYTIENKDKAVPEFQVAMTHVEQSAAVTTGGSSVTLSVNDGQGLNYVEVGSGAGYTVDMTSTKPGDHKDVALSGTAGEGGASIAQSGGKLYATGTEGGALRVDGKEAGSGILAGETSEAPGLPGAETEPMFTDVPSDAYYYDAVRWAVKEGITSGVGNNCFGPGRACTRSQAVTFLWRAAGSPQAGGSTGFTDVPADAYYADAVKWAVQQGITGGVGNNRFDPNGTCTRAQIATFLWRAAGSPAMGGGTGFTDVPADVYYAAPVQWAVQEGITNGMGAGLFGPSGVCNRGQIVTFLYRAR